MSAILPDGRTINTTDTHITIKVDTHEPCMRIDQFIAQQLPAYSRSFFKKLIDQNSIFLNNNVVKKSGTMIKPHDTISIRVPSMPTLDEQTIKDLAPDVTIVYEHAHFFIIYKPAGLTVHKPHTHSTEITLVDWLLAHHQELASVGPLDRPGIVHRLDKNTSGLLVIARTNYAHSIFSSLFKSHALTKTYLALVQGHPPRQGMIDLAIGRHPTVKTKMIALSLDDQRARSINKLRNALTHYEVQQYFDTYSLVRINLVTGRTHQIRAHFAAIGHPVVGDSTYGQASPLIPRQALHAAEISFTFDGVPFSFSQPLPSDIQKLIDTATQ